MSILLLSAYAVGLLSAIVLRPTWGVAAALVIFTFVPVEYLTTYRWYLAFTPATVTVIVAAAKHLLVRSPTRLRPSFGAAEIVLIAMIAMFWLNQTFVNRPAGVIAWNLGMTVNGLFLPLLLSLIGLRAARPLVTTWLWLGGVVGAFAIVERFVLQSNPVFGRVFATAQASMAVTQRWSEYRATTTLGHPLLNSTFLCIAVLVGAGLLVHKVSVTRLILTAITAVGVICTGSRSGIITVLTGLAVILLVGFWSDLRATARFTVWLAIAAIPMVYIASGALATRLASDEALTSTDYRLEMTRGAAAIIAKSPIWGFGSSNLAQAAAQVGLNNSGNFEDSWVDLSIGLGLPIAALLAVFLLLLGVRSIRNRQLPGLGAIIGYVISLSSFNLLFGHVSWIFLLGLIPTLTLGTPEAPAAVRATSTSRRFADRTAFRERAYHP